MCAVTTRKMSDTGTWVDPSPVMIVVTMKSSRKRAAAAMTARGLENLVVTRTGEVSEGWSSISQ
jgi:hypothetical protein